MAHLPFPTPFQQSEFCLTEMSSQTLSGRVLQKLSAAFIFDLKLALSLRIRKKKNNNWIESIRTKNSPQLVKE